MVMLERTSGLIGAASLVAQQKHPDGIIGERAGGDFSPDFFDSIAE
jgi:hypothetical protein